MGTTFDKQQAFETFFYQAEGFHLLAERCWDEIAANPEQQAALIKQWMQVAFDAGAKAMADDTIATLCDYGTAVAGLPIVTNSASDPFDIAAENLELYYNDIFEEKNDESA